jgi:hypothetical protein
MSASEKQLSFTRATSITNGHHASSSAPPPVSALNNQRSEGGYTARALGHSIFTEAESMDALRAQIRDPVKCHFEDGQSPKVLRLHFVREEVIAA